MDDEELDEGETIELDAEDDDVEDTADGGAMVKLDEDTTEQERSPDFYKNLAEEMPDPDLSRISTQYLELITRDKEARKKRDEQYEEGLRRTGLGDDAPGGASFQGATRVVHPMMTEACVDFAARAMKELFPPQGPAKDFIPGEVTIAKAKKASRKTKFMNWQLTVQSQSFRGELEQLLTQVPLGGAQYLKLSWSEKRNRPDFLFVAIDDMYLPFAATNFYSAQRRTHVQYLTELDYKDRVRSGMYRNVDLVPASQEPERSAADVANDKIEGRSDTSYNEDGLRTVYEIYALATLEDDDKDAEPAPYIITIDKTSAKVLAIYRNWDEHDDSKEELQWFVEFPFVPWRGAYPIGLPQMIGGLSAGATGALRALLDAAHISNSQTMLKLKGGSKGGQSLSIQPTQIEEIEGGLNVDDIRKLAMPLPFNPPSPVLFQLLGFMIDAGRGVVRTTLDDIADGNPNAPVGTTLAKLEQGMVVFSAIHARLHAAMGNMLRILHRLNGMYLNDEDIEMEVGEEIASREDFDGPMDVVPVSDPNIFSEAQRFAQVQAIAQRAAALPQLYNMRKVEERILDTLKVPNAKDLLNPPVEPKQQNAVNENVAATLGRPILAFPEQDHVAHLQAHLSYMLSPTLGASKLMAPALLPLMLGHIKEHLALWYASAVFELGTEVAGTDIGDAMKDNKDPESRKAFDRMLAEASQMVTGGAEEVFAKLPPVIDQALQLVQQNMPPQPMDPSQAAMARVKQQEADSARKAQLDSQRLQLEQSRAQMDGQRIQIEAQMQQIDQQLEKARLALEMQNSQQGAQLSAAQMQQDGVAAQRADQTRMDIAQSQQMSENQRKEAELAARSAMNTQDNLTAMQLAQLEVDTGEKFSVSTGTGINP